MYTGVFSYTPLEAQLGYNLEKSYIVSLAQKFSNLEGRSDFVISHNVNILTSARHTSRLQLLVEHFFPAKE